jgi:hypothetical protein
MQLMQLMQQRFAELLHQPEANFSSKKTTYFSLELLLLLLLLQLHSAHRLQQSQLKPVR